MRPPRAFAARALALAGKARRAFAPLPGLARHTRARARWNGPGEAPLVSVVVATYNWSNVLRLAIASALAQTYPHLEVVVVGDGCTDDSEEVVASFGDPRVRWHNLPANTGSQSLPNNKGIELARGEYVAYLGHDDIWLPSHLALLMRAVLAGGAHLGSAVAEEIGPRGSGYRGLRGASGDWEDDASMPVPSAIVHRARLTDEIGPWQDYRTIELPPDLDFVVRARQPGLTFARSHALTVFKFNSALRQDSYVLKPCEDQARYLRRIERERAFVARELVALALAFAWMGIRPPGDRLPALPEPPDPLPPGWHVTQWRRIRGLER